MGYIEYKEFGKVKREQDTTHCRHCQAIIDKAKWREDGGIWKCSKCDGPVCHFCSGQNAPLLVCDPWQAKIERQLAANEQIRKMRMA